MRTNNKKGISLIVLVITIIVMIILATAIILSLNNSGIIGKANKAKTDSDISNLKEYANVLEAEWNLMTESEKTNAGVGSSTEYVNKKFEDSGYKGALLMEDGTLYTNLNANAKKVLQEGIQIGAEVTGYTLDSSKGTTTTSGKENTAPNGTELAKGESQSVSQTEFETWRYAGISENGEIMILPDVLDSANKMKLSGKGGFVNGPSELDDVCNALYSTDKGTARSINMNDVNSILDYKGDEGGTYIENQFENKSEVKTIGWWMNQYNYDDWSREVPEEGKTIEGYESNYHEINPEDIEVNDVRRLMVCVKNISPTESPTEYYWIASNWSYFMYGGGCFGANFGVFVASQFGVGGRWWDLFLSSGESSSSNLIVRPVVEINSDVSVTYDSNANTLTLN